MLSDDMPEIGADLYEDHETWKAYEDRDHDLRRARWTAVLSGWALGRDEMVEKLIRQMDLPELIDLDASLTSLRYEMRRMIAKHEAPLVKMLRREPDAK